MRKMIFALLVLGGFAAQPALAQDAEKLFQPKACAACHSKAMKMVGPALQDIAKKYAGQDGATATLVKSIQEGSKGKWGQFPMPPNNVTDEEATALAEWVLQQG